MTLREYIIFWQETYDKHQSRPTTYAAHNYVFKNHILPGLGDMPLSELTSEMVGEFLEERRRFGNHRPGSSGLGEETMRHIHRLLQQCLDQAMRDGLIGDNPARAFHYSKPKKVNADVLTPLEMEDYLDAAERLGHLPMFMLALKAWRRKRRRSRHFCPQCGQFWTLEAGVFARRNKHRWRQLSPKPRVAGLFKDVLQQKGGIE